MTVEGSIPHLPGIEMYGTSLPAGTVGGDLYEYINFQQRYDFHARNEKPTKDFVAATPCAESAAIGYISSLASLKKSIDDSTSPQELRSRL